MNDHFMSLEDFANMIAEKQELVLTALMEAYANQEYITIRVDNKNVNSIDIHTMKFSDVLDYYQSGGVWTYSNPYALLKAMLHIDKERN